MSSRQRFDLVIVGSGPAGLATASHAHDNGLDYVLLERTDHLSDTIFCYQARKYVMAEPMAIPARGDVPFDAGSREQVLGAWESHARGKQLKVHYSKDVKSVKKAGASFELKAADGSEYEAKWVVLAMGTQGAQRKPGVPGEDMSHVLYRLADPSEYAEKDIVVVGAGDSAIEIALALADENRVSLVVRSPEIVRAKESLIREVLTRQAQGSMAVYYSTTLKEIALGHTDMSVRGETVRVRSDYIFLKLGADPPRKFFESIGVKYSSADKDARPLLTPQYESADVPGLFLIGAASGRDLIKLGMNQGWEVVEHLCGRKVDPADEAVLKERLPFWTGSVLERIAQIKARVPLLAAADDESLREMFLSTVVREYRDGEEIILQNDYTNEFLIVSEGRVQLWVTPEGSRERKKITTMTAGNFFGEMSLISGRRRTATAVAEGPTRIIEIPRKAILKLLYTSPRVKEIVDQAFLIRAIQGYLFGDTPASVLGELASKATLMTLPKDAAVFKEGDPGDAFYLIRNGMVKIAKTSNDKEIVLSYLVAGNFFGESALLEGAPRTATVTTIFPAELIKLSKRDFDQFLAGQPELRQKLLKKLEERRVLSLIAEATPGSGSILNDLIREEVVMGTHSLIIDNHKCVRCSNCIRACEGVHADGQSRLSLTGIQLYNLLAPNSCWQCQNPMCMLDCPPDALARDPRGEVYIRSNCIGCGNCERNCPYGNIFMVHPKHEGGGLFGWIKGLFRKEKAAQDEVERTLAVKCDLCREISGGPACVRSCPTGAAIRLTPEEYRSTLEELVIMRGTGNVPIPRYGLRWRVIALVLTIGLVASFAWYRGREPFMHGGTSLGLIYGFSALFLMAFLLYFGIRKRAYRSRFGTLQEWLHAHIWLGLFSFLVIVAHTGFRFQDKIAIALFVVIALVIGTGIFGALLYRTIPRELTEIQSNLTGQEISDQLNQLSKAMARLASGKSSPFQRIYYSLQREALPGFLAGWKLVLTSGKRSEKAGDWTGLVGMVEKSEQDELRQLLVASRQQKELHLRLVYQQRYRNILDFWLYLHIPLSIAMIVLIVAHVWGVFYYGVVKF